MIDSANTNPVREAAMNAVLAQMSAAEMVETVVLSYLHGGERTEGHCGSLVKLDTGEYRVTTVPVLSEANDRAAPLALTFIVWTNAAGWVASFKGVNMEGATLYEAVADALAKGARVQVSRNYPVKV